MADDLIMDDEEEDEHFLRAIDEAEAVYLTQRGPLSPCKRQHDECADEEALCARLQSSQICDGTGIASTSRARQGNFAVRCCALGELSQADLWSNLGPPAAAGHQPKIYLFEIYNRICNLHSAGMCASILQTAPAPSFAACQLLRAVIARCAQWPPH